MVTEKPDISFDEMKEEFVCMDEEIQEKTLEIKRLKQALIMSETKLKEKDDAGLKMIDQMEELHENLAELDARFERSEKMNAALQEEKEELKRDLEKEMLDAKENVMKADMATISAKNELDKLREDFDKYRSDAESKLSTLRNAFKQSLEETIEPLSTYLEKNKGSKIPVKKTKSYKLLKSVDSGLRELLTLTTNNN